MIFVIIGVGRRQEKIANQVSPCSHDHVKSNHSCVTKLSSLFILFLRFEAFYLLLESIHNSHAAQVAGLSRASAVVWSVNKDIPDIAQIRTKARFIPRTVTTGQYVQAKGLHGQLIVPFHWSTIELC